MNFGGYELQIFVSVLVVLGCAFVALLVDYLKGANEKLRESHVDLLARQETLTAQATDDTSRILTALTEQTSALKKMVDRPIQVTAMPSSRISLRDLPVHEIPAPKRQASQDEIHDLDKVKVALVPEEKVVPAEPVEAPLEVAALSETTAEVAQNPALNEELLEEAAPAVREHREEVLPPNVIRMRLMSGLQRPEPVAEAIEELAEPIFDEPAAKEIAAEPVVAEERFEATAAETLTEVVAEPQIVDATAPEADSEGPESVLADVTESELVLEETVLEEAIEEPAVSLAVEELEAVAESTVEPECEPVTAIETLAEVSEAEQISLPMEEPVAVAVEEPVVAELPETAPEVQPAPEPMVAQDEVQSEPEDAPAAEPDFNQFLDDLVSEFEQNPAIYEAPEPVHLEPAAFATPEPISALSSEPMLPTLGSEPESALVETTESNLEEFTPNLELPIGTFPASVLQELAARKELLTGLVVSVGINEFDQVHENLGKPAADELLRSVDGLMTSLAGDDGFCCRIKPDEFVLAFAKLSGPNAQRRLSELSERLWDFQLRNLGTFSVVFSWGATEAQRESLTDAIASAVERMKETQNSRRSVSMDRGRRRRATA